MGQQQLLLLVLGIVIVGLAVVVGIEAFDENERKTRQDQTMVLLSDIATKAIAWKKTPPALGGGDNGDPDDYRGITFADLGYEATEVQSGRDVALLTDYACVKLYYNSNGSGLQVNALRADCTGGSWWMQLYLRGSDYDDISFNYRENQSQNNGQ
ncbi:MAG: hypothetical protein AAGF99_15105 [Bacteroidota bacterium]